MEKDIDRIPKNPETDIVIRIDDFGGKRGLTIREFVRSERYTGFTKAGTRIPVEHFNKFKEAINSIDVKELEEAPVEGAEEGDSSGNEAGESKAEGQKEDASDSDAEIEEKAM